MGPTSSFQCASSRNSYDCLFVCYDLCFVICCAKEKSVAVCRVDFALTNIGERNGWRTGGLGRHSSLETVCKQFHVFFAQFRGKLSNNSVKLSRPGRILVRCFHTRGGLSRFVHACLCAYSEKCFCWCRQKRYWVLSFQCWKNRWMSRLDCVCEFTPFCVLVGNCQQAVRSISVGLVVTPTHLVDCGSVRCFLWGSLHSQAALPSCMKRWLIRWRLGRNFISPSLFVIGGAAVATCGGVGRLQCKTALTPDLILVSRSIQLILNSFCNFLFNEQTK